MLARYKIPRGRRVALPLGVRRDIRAYRESFLSPPRDLVERYLADPSDAAWRDYTKTYRALLEERFREDRTPFDELAALAKKTDVYIGCSCPTSKNPNVRHCHTWLALEFMRARYPELEVVFPE